MGTALKFRSLRLISKNMDQMYVLSHPTEALGMGIIQEAVGRRTWRISSLDNTVYLLTIIKYIY